MSGLRIQVREECLAGQRVLRRTADKWSCLLVASLVEGAMHFNELRRSLKGISQWSLTRALRGLERDGMISRMVAPTIPPQVDYQLTELGWNLVEQLRALGAWAMKQEPAIRQARDAFDTEHARSPRRTRFARVTSLWPRDRL
jgi:DNA-binding HxlR family transcriptional regulator